jgi:hypothetical protein
MLLPATTRALALATAGALATCNAKTESISTITFERTPCFGTCPVYRVNVSGNGDVKFEGIRNVDSVGTYAGHIDGAAVSRLARAVADAKYFSLQSSYGQANCAPYATDAARILTSVSTPEQSKSIDHDLGCGSAAPPALAELYRQFDDIIGTARWIGHR